MFKAIGRVDAGFVARVVAAVRTELDSDEDPPYKLQQTASGRHVSVTIEPTVQTSYQVLAIYQRIRDTAGLVMLW
jgi:putative lipoic acid-binding regulatory protein